MSKTSGSLQYFCSRGTFFCIFGEKQHKEDLTIWTEEVRVSWMCWRQSNVTKQKYGARRIQSCLSRVFCWVCWLSNVSRAWTESAHHHSLSCLLLPLLLLPLLPNSSHPSSTCSTPQTLAWKFCCKFRFPGLEFQLHLENDKNESRCGLKQCLRSTVFVGFGRLSSFINYLFFISGLPQFSPNVKTDLIPV